MGCGRSRFLKKIVAEYLVSGDWPLVNLLRE